MAVQRCRHTWPLRPSLAFTTSCLALLGPPLSSHVACQRRSSPESGFSCSFPKPARLRTGCHGWPQRAGGTPTTASRASPNRRSGSDRCQCHGVPSGSLTTFMLQPRLLVVRRHWAPLRSPLRCPASNRRGSSFKRFVPIRQHHFIMTDETPARHVCKANEPSLTVHPRPSAARVWLCRTGRAADRQSFVDATGGIRRKSCPYPGASERIASSKENLRHIVSR